MALALWSIAVRVANMRVTIYHNQKCGTSRSVVEIVRAAGIEPQIVEYLKTPLSLAHLTQLAQQLGNAADLLRRKEPLVVQLGLQEATDEAILAAIAQHPILLNRPVVVTDKGTKICRPAELVQDLL